MFLIIELNFFLLNVYYKILISFLSNILLDNMVMIKQLQKNNYYKISATQMLQRLSLKCSEFLFTIHNCFYEVVFLLWKI